MIKSHKMSVNASTWAHTRTHKHNTAHIRAEAALGGFGMPGPPRGSNGFLFASLSLVKMLKTDQTRAVLIQQNCC